MKQARSFPGLDDFMRQKSATALTSAAKGGYCIVFTGTTGRCDVLVLDHAGVRHIPLVKLDKEMVESLANQINGLLRSANIPRRRHFGKKNQSGPDTLEKAFIQVLAQMWRGILSPIIEALDIKVLRVIYHSAIPR